VITATLDTSLEILPYPGLRPFREDETHLYFGREQHRGELLKRLAITRFVAVIGTSGSGKSSLVRAGLLPDLLSGYLAGTGCDWIIVESTPGADPLGRLAAAFVTAGWVTDATALRTNSAQIVDLAGRHLTPGQHVLVLVDQFEELFRLKTSEDAAEDADEKAAFVRLLLNAGGQRTDVTAQNTCVHVVMAMRSEFLGRASVYRGLPEAIDQGQYLIPRLSRAQLRKAIESPARVAGGELEEALVQRLLNELGDDQDQLPVLQHALMRCWQFRDGQDRIGLEAYDKSGQLASALSLDANEALAETRQALGARGERIVARVFQALRETDVNGGQTRRPTAVEDLCELTGCTIDELTTALAPFRRRSFVVPAPDTLLDSSTLLDISHEALLRRWDTLRHWIDEDEVDRTRYMRLATRAAEEQSSEHPQYLVPPLLDLLLKFWAERNPSRVWALRHHKGYERAKAFLDESERHRRAREQEEANRRTEESRQKQALEDAVAKRARTRQRAAVTVAFAATILFGGGFALWNAWEQEERLEALLIAAKLPSVPEGEIEARLQLAAEVARRRQDPESWQELLKILFIAPMPRQAGWGPELDQDVVSVAISPGDQWLYAVAGDRLRAFELASGQERVSMPLSEYPGSSPDPFLLASGEKLLMFRGGLASIVDGRTLRVLSEPVSATAFTVSRDGGQAALLGSDGVTLCNLNSNCESRSRHDVKDLSASDLELSADGASLVILGDSTDDDRRPIALFSTTPWKQRKTRLIDDVDESLAMGVDKDHVHLCTPDNLRQYDAFDDTLDEQILRQFVPRAEECRFFGERTVTSHADGGIRVWDSAGALVAQTTAAASVDRSWRMALGDRTLVAASDEGIQAWDITSYGRQNVAAGLVGFGRGNVYAFSEDALVTLDSGAATPGPNLQFGDRMLLAVSDSLGLAAFFDSETGEFTLAAVQPRQAPRPRWRQTIPSEPSRVIFSPDERHVAIVSIEGFLGKISTVIRNADDGTVVRELPGRSLIAFAPTGEVLTLGDENIVIVSLENGSERFWPDVKLESSELSAAFSPDGRRLALAVPGDQHSVVEVYEWPGQTRLEGGLQHSAIVTSLSFNADGQTLLTSTTEGTTHSWNLATREEILRIPPQGGGSRAVFTPSGRIAILDESGLNVLSASPNDLLTEACRRIVRNLTTDEWALFVGSDVPYQRTCPDRP
jgi:WD40 repeat protein